MNWINRIWKTKPHSSTNMKCRRREGWEWERGTGPSILTRLGRQTEVCVWWWGLAAAWLGGREGGRRGGGGKGSERGWRAGGRGQILNKYRPARRTWHTHTSVTTAPLWAFVCVRICGWEWTEVVKWKGDFLMWPLFALGEVCCQVLRMAGKQKNKSKREKQKVRTKNSTRTHT